jgi:UDP:flavonoid glycosyltransferase YjiC (YdhE family)
MISPGTGRSMARFAFVTWEGGGNVSVALGIGVALLERGHAVSVLGPRSLRLSIERVGLGYVELGVPAPREPAARSEFLVDVVTSQRCSSEFGPLLDVLAPDGVIVDCNLSWALERAMAVPTAVLVHTALGLYLPVWQPVIDAANTVRIADGLAPFGPAAQVWSSHTELLVASMRLFDRPPVPTPGNAHYIGPVRVSGGDAETPPATHGPSSWPLVLITYSTDPLQNRPGRVQRALDGLADLPVRVVATTSGTFDVGHLAAPSNAVVVDYVSHDRVMTQAAVVVGHAGHGTTLTALCHGVPLVCVPGLGRDQLPIAERVHELGVGIALSTDATSPEIGRAVAAILGDDGYRDRARRFAARCNRQRGADTAAARLEGMVGTC